MPGAPPLSTCLSFHPSETSRNEVPDPCSHVPEMWIRLGSEPRFSHVDRGWACLDWQDVAAQRVVYEELEYI